MDNYRDIDNLELAAFRSGKTHEEYRAGWVSVGPTDGRSSRMSKADVVKELMPGINELFFPSEKPKGEYMIEEDDDIQDYKRPWVGLTDEEIDKTYWRREPFRRPTQFEFARDIEQLLKEKNNG
jgi:hypothetical protein